MILILILSILPYTILPLFMMNDEILHFSRKTGELAENLIVI